MPILTLGRRATKGVPYGETLMTANAMATGANTTETDFATYTFGPSALTVGEGFRLHLGLVTAANANTKRVRVYFGATTIFDSTALASNNESWDLSLVLLRTGSAAQAYTSRGQRASSLFAIASGTATEDMSTAKLLRVTGTNGTANANDLTLRTAVLERLG